MNSKEIENKIQKIPGETERIATKKARKAAYDKAYRERIKADEKMDALKKAKKAEYDKARRKRLKDEKIIKEKKAKKAAYNKTRRERLKTERMSKEEARRWETVDDYKEPFAAFERYLRRKREQDSLDSMNFS